MTPTLQRLRPIGLCLLAAVLLHSLVLSLLQLQRQRLKPQEISGANTRSSDDTPELLRFSRQQAQAGTPSVVPLPGFGALPPPPPATMPTPADPPARSGRPGGHPDLRPASAQGSGAVKPGKPGTGRRNQTPAPKPENGSSKAAAPSAPRSELDSPLASLERLKRRASDSSDSHSGGDSPGEPILLRPDASAQTAFQALWESARVESGSPAGSNPLPTSLERRMISLAQARRSGVPVAHNQGVVLADQLVVFWIQGDQLWLLRTKLTPS